MEVMINRLKFETTKEGEKVIVRERVVLDFYIEGLELSSAMMRS